MGEDANDEVSPGLGLPPLPVVAWPEVSTDEERENKWFGLHWKTRGVVAHAAGRPFAWLDDEISEGDREWVGDNHPGPVLLRRVEAAVGLTAGDIEALRHWVDQLPGYRSRRGGRPTS